MHSTAQWISKLLQAAGPHTDPESLLVFHGLNHSRRGFKRCPWRFAVSPTSPTCRCRLFLYLHRFHFKVTLENLRLSYCRKCRPLLDGSLSHSYCPTSQRLHVLPPFVFQLVSCLHASSSSLLLFASSFCFLLHVLGLHLFVLTRRH